MTANNLYVDIHVLQVLPPSCVNRDDTGSPKTAIYGGVPRARVSSQCWKKAMRDMFREVLNTEDVGIRTKHIADLIADEIEKLGGKNAAKLAEEILKAANLKLKENKKDKAMMETGALFFISPKQIKTLAELAAAGEKDKKKVQAALNAEPSLDIALFGRMVADDPALNTDACAQVAHGISTHKIVNEYDYFTAMDDKSKEDSAGAGMLGTVEYNSSTMYRYATVAVHALKDNLGDETAKAVKEFVRCFAASMPTGKINTFANRTLPSAMMVTIRRDQPINLVGAFEKPVAASDSGYVENSCKALVRHTRDMYKNWLSEPEKSYIVGDGLNELGNQTSFSELLDALEKDIEAYSC